jgi:general secretion pathway protein D
MSDARLSPIRLAVPLVMITLLGCMPPPGRQQREFGVEGGPAAEGAPTPLTPSAALPGPTEPLAIAPERPVARRVVDRGSGQFAGRPARVEVAPAEAGEVTLSFVDADIRDVVRAILQDTLGENYVIDPQVSGTVTLQSSRPLALAELHPLLDTVLRLNGAALVRDGGINRIVPLDRAAAEGLRPSLREAQILQGAGYGLRVIPLAHARAEEMARLVQPFVPATAIVEVQAERNLLVVTGTPDQIATVQELVDMFDSDWLAGMSFALEPLRSANAEELVPELEQMFAAGEQGQLQGRLRFVPVPRLNAVLVIAAEPAHLERARRWIQELDQGLDTEPRLYIYHVQHGSAAALAEVLQAALGAGGAVLGREPLLAPGRTGFAIGAQARGGQGGAPRRTGAAGSMGTTAGGSTATESAGGGADFGLLPSSPTEQAGGGPSFGAGLFGPGPGAGSEELRVTADPTTNSLVIQATPQKYRMIEQALGRLDIVPLQVMIEATVAEVTLNNELRFGLEWFFRFGDVSGSLTRNEFLQPTPFVPGFTAILNTSDVRVVLSALDQITDVQVISSPQLLVLDNQIARLQVGDEVPIVTQQAQSVTNPDAPLVNSVDYRDSGVILEVRPRVSGSGLAVLEIAQEVSRVTQTLTSNIDSPTINQRRVTTTVAVHSGETVALGGLIQNRNDNADSGIPVLRDIPVLGVLFGSQRQISERTELLVLLTPRVLSGREDARAVTQDLRRRIHALPENPRGPSRVP